MPALPLIKMKKLLYIMWLFPAMALTGCYYDVEEELYPMACDTTASAYTASVQVILQANCYSCHSSSIAEGSVTLDSYANARTWAMNGRLSGAIRHDAGF